MTTATPSPRTRRSLGAALATAVVLLLASCGGGGSSSGAERPEDPVSGVDVRDSGSSGAENASPLTEYMGDAPSTEDLRALERMRGKAVSDCMRKQGFEYIHPTTAEESQSRGGLAPEVYAERWGFGISTTIDASGRALPDAVYEGEAGLTPGGPSEEVDEAMSGAERKAYDTALVGEFDPTATDWGGCMGEGFATSKAQDEIDELLAEVYEKIEKDPRRLEVDATFGDCMAEAGFSGIAEVSDPYERISDRFVELTGHEPLDQSAEVRPVDAGKLAELQKEERAMAVAHAACRPVYEKAYAALSATYEEEIIAQHQPLMEELRKESEKERRDLEAFKAGEPRKKGE